MLRVFERVPESRRHERIQFSLTILAHVGKRAGRIHVHLRRRGKNIRLRHNERRNGCATESHVHAVTHPGIVTADDQVDLFGTGGMPRCLALTGNVGRRGGQQRAT